MHGRNKLYLANNDENIANECFPRVMVDISMMKETRRKKKRGEKKNREESGRRESLK